MRIAQHLRRTFMAGIFAAIPIVVTVWVVLEIDRVTRMFAPRILDYEIPFLGLLVAIVAIYVLGWIVKSVLGRWFMNRLDRFLSHMPLLKSLYAAWKQVVVVSERDSMYSRVALVSDDDGHRWQIGFTNGKQVAGHPPRCCVYIPGAPNPLAGQLVFVELDRIRYLSITADEAFKSLLSSGNYLPPLEEVSALSAPPDPEMKGLN